MAADPRPANDSAPIRPSLFDRAIDAARGGTRSPPVAVPEPTPPPEPPVPPVRAPRRPLDRPAVALAVAILAMPLLTLIGAMLLTARVRADADTLAQRSAPAIALRASQDRARTMLTTAWAAPTLGTTMEAIARTLPADAALLRIERGDRGALSIDVAAPDPDRALAALRRDPVLAGLRAVAQARAGDDGRMRITLEQGR